MPTRLSSSITWKKLHQHQKEIVTSSLCELFSTSNQRAHSFSLEAAGLHLDYSKNLITKDTLDLFQSLAQELNFDATRKSLREGEPINHTENRPALHTALRDKHSTPIYVKDSNISDEISSAKKQMAAFVKQLHQGKALGGSGKIIRDVVNIGIGGSYLGPKMVVEALTPYQQNTVQCHFVANIDGSEITETLKKLNPETTLFIVASKSFGTQETLHNAIAAREWICQHPQLKTSVDKHFVAVSSNICRR